jgi:dienelactone hydrolase
MRHFLLLSLLVTAAQAELPWDIKQLQTTMPEVKWLDQKQPVHSMLYTGEKIAGKETQVFAFYASPKTLGKGSDKVPGVVLIHGGGGTAFVEWAHLWAQRGYAAIAMDLSGRRPDAPQFDTNGAYVRKPERNIKRIKLEHGGLDHTHVEKFESIGGAKDDDWPWHAVCSVMRAHTLLRSMPEVDAERTAVTGISWGGYTTCLAASVDDRFKAAAPVYGCGFLADGDSVQRRSIDQLGELKAQWIASYDPGSHLPQCRVPIFFVNGTHDIHYPLLSYLKSHDAVPGEKHLRLEHKMAHGHPPGWAPAEIQRFFDSKLRGGPALAVGKSTTQADGSHEVTWTSPLPIIKAELLVTTDTGPSAKRPWQISDLSVEKNRVLVPAQPAAAVHCLVNLTDSQGCMTTVVLKQ